MRSLAAGPIAPRCLGGLGDMNGWALADDTPVSTIVGDLHKNAEGKWEFQTPFSAPMPAPARHLADHLKPTDRVLEVDCDLLCVHGAVEVRLSWGSPTGEPWSSGRSDSAQKTPGAANPLSPGYLAAPAAMG